MIRNPRLHRGVVCWIGLGRSYRTRNEASTGISGGSRSKKLRDRLGAAGELPLKKPSVMNSTEATEAMRSAWDKRAKENAEYYVATGSAQWDRRDFFRSGEI